MGSRAGSPPTSTPTARRRKDGGPTWRPAPPGRPGSARSSHPPAGGAAGAGGFRPPRAGLAAAAGLGAGPPADVESPAARQALWELSRMVARSADLPLYFDGGVPGILE